MDVTGPGGQANAGRAPGGAGRATLGRAAAWARDLAIVGAATALLAGLGIERRLEPVMVVAAGVGAVVGALFGVGFRRLLLAWLRLPIVAWIPISLVLGALFGGSTGLIAGVVAGEARGTALLTVFAAIAGALQLFWFWLPYAVRAGRGKPTWPLVAAAVVLGGPIGYAALRVLFAVIGLHYHD
jgi:hypothetical protein